MKRPVGILGGMGPEATVLLMRKVIAAVPARDDADHIPLIVDQNPQVPSRIARLVDGAGANPEPVLRSMAKRLAAAGAVALAMPCNTAHHYADAIRESGGVPFLDMISLSTWAAAAAGKGPIGLLASPAVASTGLFDGPMADAGRELARAPDDAALLSAIRAVKAGNMESARDILAMQSRALKNLGADVQILACTEFSLLADAMPEDVTVVDAMDALVAEIIRVSMKSAE